MQRIKYKSFDFIPNDMNMIYLFDAEMLWPQKQNVFVYGYH